MANESLVVFAPNQTMNGIALNATGLRWNGTAFVATSAISDAAWATGGIAYDEGLTSDGTRTGEYRNTTSLPAGTQTVAIYLGALAPANVAIATWTAGMSVIGTVTLDASQPNYAPATSTQATTLLARIIGTLAAGTHNPQSGDSYPIVSNGTYGNSAAFSSLSTAIANIQNGTFIGSNIPSILERPDAGSVVITLAVYFSDETGAAKDLDSGDPAITLVNDAGTDLSSRLSGWTHAATGKYTLTYTNGSTNTIEGLHWEITGTINSKLRRWMQYAQIVDTTAVDFTSADRTALNAINTLTVANLNATITSRMASYTQPTGFLAATFPSGTVANTTNITAGTITTATNLTNAPTAGDFTAAMKASLNSSTPTVTLGNTAHGGPAATLTMSFITVSNTTSGNAVNISSASGYACNMQGGIGGVLISTNSGPAFDIQPSGDAFNIAAGGTNTIPATDASGAALATSAQELATQNLINSLPAAPSAETIAEAVDAEITESHGSGTYGGATVNILPGSIGPVSGGTSIAVLPNAWQKRFYQVSFPVIDRDGEPIDLSGVELTMELWDPNSSPGVEPTTALTAATSITTVATLSVGGTDNNVVTLTINPAGLPNAVAWQWLLYPTANAGNPYTSGKLPVLAAPTA